MPYADPAKKAAYLKKYWAARGTGTKFNVQVDDAMHGEVRARAGRQKVTVSELVRTYIEWGLENDGAVTFR